MAGFARPSAIIFTDLDGTLLDIETYSYFPALDAVRRVAEKNIPLIFCSSKTYAEQRFYQEQMCIGGPMIVENGSAIFIPRNYFTEKYRFNRVESGCEVIELGVRAEKILGALMAARKHAWARFKAFSEMDLNELCRLTGLETEAALRAQRRRYSETIVCDMSASEMESLREALKERGLACIRGSRFHTVVALEADKGHAVRLLTELFRKQMGEVKTIGIGDSANDAGMLAAVDLPFLLQKPDESWEDMPSVKLRKVEGYGPVTWNSLVCRLLDESPDD